MVNIQNKIYEIITTENFTKQLLKLNGEIIDEIDSPTTSIDSELISNIKGLSTEDELFVGYNNTIVYLAGNMPFPNASLMHFYLAETLKKNDEISKKGPKTFADLGCGLGFLGNYVAKNFQSAENGKIIFSDLGSLAINFSFQAYMKNNNLKWEDLKQKETEKGISFIGNKEKKLQFLIGNALETLANKKADITMACPVYIPEICEVFPQAYLLFGQVSKQLGADFYFAHTNLNDTLIEESAKQIGANLVDIASKEMPFVVDTVSQISEQGTSDEKMQKLVNLGLKYKENEKYKMWHEIKVSKMSF